MASGKKIADGVGKMSSSPFIEWLRSILVRTRRVKEDLKTPVREEFLNQQRFPSDQSARTQPPPNVPGGVHHRLAGNYYLEHDARRSIEPPKVVVDRALSEKALIAAEAQKLHLAAVGPQVSLGPVQNFGLPSHIATPGFGHEWTRNRMEELPTQQNDEEFVPLERYDAYRQSAAQ